MITNYLLSGMVGIMLFFTVVVAPTVFKVLPVEWSSKYVRNFFPKYYVCLGLITTASIFTAPDGVSKVLLAICALLFAFTFAYLTGKINEAKDNGQNRRFHLLHGTSVVINVFQLITFIYILVKLS
jgi:Sec-independent protein secretion pathway component TatC